MTPLKLEDLKPEMKVEYLKSGTWVPAEILYIIYEARGIARASVKHSGTWSTYVDSADVGTYLRPPQPQPDSFELARKADKIRALEEQGVQDAIKIQARDERIKALEELLKFANLRESNLRATITTLHATADEIRLIVEAKFGQDIREILRCLVSYKAKFLAARQALA